ncbi:hypothetical protein CWB36_24925 [Bacillus cereus]|nr:hypothetical protein [Bacillus cereus]
MKLYQRFSQYIYHNFKYINDFPNISIITQNISTVFQIYRFADNSRQKKQELSSPCLLTLSIQFVSIFLPHP